MTTIGARSVAAAAALKPLGLSLTVSPDEFIITVGPDDKATVVARCTSIDEVDAWIADHRPTGAAAKPIEQRRAPQVGDDVHYVSHGSPVRPDGTQAYKSACRAAKVTEATSDTVCLFVMNPNGTFNNQGTRYDGGILAAPPREAIGNEPPFPQITCGDLTFEGGTWHWPGDQ